MGLSATSNLKPVRPSQLRVWLPVVLCTIAIAINFVDRATLALANLPIRQDLGITATQIGLLQSVWSISFAATQLPVGLLVDRLGARPLLTGALVLWSLAQAAGGMFVGFTALLWSRAALGVFEAPGYPASVRVVSDWFAPADRGKPTGLYTLGGEIGRVVGLPLLTLVMLAYGWRAMFVVMGVVGLVFAAGLFSLIGQPPRAAGGTPPPKVTLRSWRRLFGFDTMRGLMMASFCTSYAIWMFGTWTPAYLEMQHHVSIHDTGMLAALPVVCSIVGSILGGIVTDKMARSDRSLLDSRKIPMVLAFLAAAVFCALASVSGGLVMALGFICASLFCISFAQSAKWTLLTVVAPPTYEASVASISNCGSYIGGAVSPLITGMIVDATGSFVLALAAGAAMLLIGALLYWHLVRQPISLDSQG